MSRAERHEQAVNVIHEAHKTYGMHPTRRQERYINTELSEWLHDDASSAQITEMLAAAHDMTNLQGRDLSYKGMDIEPGDHLYPDALLDHQTSIETDIYRVLQEIEKE